MYAFELGLAIAFSAIGFFFIRIKLILRANGRHVSYLTGWLSDYRRFMQLIASEDDPKARNQYITILFGLHAGFVVLIMIALLGAFMY